MKNAFFSAVLFFPFLLCTQAKPLNEMEFDEARALIQSHIDKSDLEGIALEGSKTRARIAKFSDDGSLIAVGFGKRIAPRPDGRNFIDPSVKVYSKDSYQVIARLFTDDYGLPHSFTFLSKNQLLVGYDSGAIVWEMDSEKILSSHLPKLKTFDHNPPPSTIEDSFLVPDRDTLLLTGRGQVHVFDFEKMEELSVFRTPWHISGFFLPDGRYASSHNRDLKFWEPDTWKVQQTISCESQIRSIGLSKDEQILYLAASNPNEHPALDIYKVNLSNNTIEGPLLTVARHKDNITMIDFLPDLGSILTSSYDRTTKIWNIQTGELEATYPFDTTLAACGEIAIVEGFIPIALKLKKSNKPGDDNSE